MVAIYRIFRLGGNRLYIGSASAPRQRKNRHWLRLRRNDHHCIQLQRSWNKHGESNFVFEVFDWAEDGDGLQREQYWIDFYAEKNLLYNTYLTAGSPTRGGKLSEEHKAKIALAGTGKKASPSSRAKRVQYAKEYSANPENQERMQRFYAAGKTPEALKKSADSRRGMKIPSIAVSLSQSWPGLISPEGEIFDPIVNMAAFARDHGLLLGNVMKLLRGELHHTHGWTRVHPPNTPKRPSK